MIDFINLRRACLASETRSREKRATPTPARLWPCRLTCGKFARSSWPTPITVRYHNPVALGQKFSSGGTGKPLGFSIVGDEPAAPGAGQQLHRRDHLHRHRVGPVGRNATNNILSRSPDATRIARRRMLTSWMNSAPLSTAAVCMALEETGRAARIAAVR